MKYLKKFNEGKIKRKKMGLGADEEDETWRDLINYGGDKKETVPAVEPPHPTEITDKEITDAAKEHFRGDYSNGSFDMEKGFIYGAEWLREKLRSK